MPEHAPSRGAPRIRPTAVRRLVPDGRDLGSSLGSGGPTIVSLSLDRPNGQDLNLPVISRWIQAYCRRIVNQNKRIMALCAGPPDPVFSPLCGTVFRITHGRGASAMFPLDWHYARKSGFDKYA